MLESRRRSAAAAAPAPAPVPAPPTREAEEAVAEAAALRSEVERLQSEAVTLRRTLLLERQRATDEASAAGTARMICATLREPLRRQRAELDSVRRQVVTLAEEARTSM